MANFPKNVPDGTKITLRSYVYIYYAASNKWKLERLETE
jgi:hypothetical protein